MVRRCPHLLSVLLLGLAMDPAGADGQSEEESRQQPTAVDRFRYAHTPDELLPYRGVRPYKDFFMTVPEFWGPGREKTDPAPVSEVRIGFIGPLAGQDGPALPSGFRSGVRNETKALFGRRMLRGARLAVEEANRDGGYRGKPFRLVLRTDLVQWGQTSDEMVKFAYQDKVWAVLSGMDSNHNHVLLRATLKTEVPIVNAGSTDPTLTETGIPWIVRCINDDRQNAYMLLDYIYRVEGLTRVAVLRVNDRDGRLGILEFLQGARRLRHPVLMELRFLNGDTDFRDQLLRIRALKVEAVVLWGNPREAALIVKQMRELGMEHPVFGFDRTAHPLFLELVGDAGEGVVAVSSYNPTLAEPRWQGFRRRYRERFAEEPDAFAAHAYDGMNIVIGAIRKAGLNRTRIRDALFSLESFPGVTGRILFDTTLNDVSPPWLARVENGRLRYFRPPGWKPPAWRASIDGMNRPGGR